MSKLIVEETPIQNSSGSWDLTIRCVTNIEKGDRLLTATPYTVGFEEGRTSCTQIEGVSFPVDLVIDRIDSYGKSWDLLYAGMTAKISVVGDASAISKRTYLAG